MLIVVGNGGFVLPFICLVNVVVCCVYLLCFELPYKFIRLLLSINTAIVITLVVAEVFPDTLLASWWGKTTLMAFSAITFYTLKSLIAMAVTTALSFLFSQPAVQTAFDFVESPVQRLVLRHHNETYLEETISGPITGHVLVQIITIGILGFVFALLTCGFYLVERRLTGHTDMLFASFGLGLLTWVSLRALWIDLPHVHDTDVHHGWLCDTTTLLQEGVSEYCPIQMRWPWDFLTLIGLILLLLFFRRWHCPCWHRRYDVLPQSDASFESDHESSTGHRG